MKTLIFRTIFSLFLIVIVVFTLAVNVHAKHDTTITQGWSSPTTQHLEIGPPSFSVHPINDPGDVPLFRAQIKQYFQELKEYIASIFDNIRLTAFGGLND